MITENSRNINVSSWDAGRPKSKKQQKKRKKNETEDEVSGEETEADSSEEDKRNKSSSKRKKAKVESKDDSTDVKKKGNPFGSLISAKNREKVSKNSTIITGKDVIPTCVELCRLYGKDLSHTTGVFERRRKSEVNIF